MNRIVDGYLNWGKKGIIYQIKYFYTYKLMKLVGFGDASSVGAGKTLTALAVMAKIFNHTRDYPTNFKGFLVLIPVK